MAKLSQDIKTFTFVKAAEPKLFSQMQNLEETNPHLNFSLEKRLNMASLLTYEPLTKPRNSMKAQEEHK